MSASTSTAVERTADRVAARAASNGGGLTVLDLINRQMPEIERALPKHLDPDRLARIAITTIKQTPALAKCDGLSLIGAIMISAQLGLEPGGPLGQAYLVPYGNQCQFILGYRGIIELARRSGKLQSIEAHEVCENDEFSYSYGLDDHLRHTPLLKGDRGDTYAYYAVAKFIDGGHAFVVLSKEEINKHRKRSKSSGNGPWVTDYDSMARKTCIRVLAPFLPLSPELDKAIRSDESAHRRIEPDMADVPGDELIIDGNVIDVPSDEDTPDADPETGEVTPLAQLVRRYETLTGKSKSLYNGQRRDAKLPEFDKPDEWTPEHIGLANGLIDEIAGVAGQPEQPSLDGTDQTDTADRA